MTAVRYPLILSSADKMSILLHVCCGPCLIGIDHWLKEKGYTYTGYFYNPNIHPLIEFRRRLKAVKMLKYERDLPLTIDEQYGLHHFLHTIVPVAHQRCQRCLRMRLEETAKRARQRKFEAFSTTLLGSPHQDHQSVVEIGRSVAEAVGVPFFYQDWRSLHQFSHEEARRRGLYLQNYCGCIYSEYDRFKDSTHHLYKPRPGSRTVGGED